MLFVVTAVVPIISTTSLSPLNSPRPGSSTRLLISMDVTPRRPIHRAAPRRQSTRSFSFISISRALYSFYGKRSALEILFHLASPGTQTTRCLCISAISIHTRRARYAPILLSHAPLIGAHRYTHQSAAPRSR